MERQRKHRHHKKHKEYRLNKALTKEIVCQERVDEDSQFVIMQGDFIIKGPYLPRHRDTILERRTFFESWKTPHMVLPLKEMSTPDGIFLVYPNLARDYPIIFRWHTEESTGLRYRVLKRRGLRTIWTILSWDDGEMNFVIQKAMPSLLLALVQCFILEIGDIYLTNILVDVHKKKIYVIDFDDDLKRERYDEFFYFRVIPSEPLMKRWLLYARPCYLEVASQLRELKNRIGGSSVIVKRIHLAITLLERYTEKKVVPEISWEWSSDEHSSESSSKSLLSSKLSSSSSSSSSSSESSSESSSASESSSSSESSSASD